LLLDRQFEKEFTKFCENVSIEEHKFSSNHIEKMEYIDHNCEDAFMDNEHLFFDELVSAIRVVKKFVVRILSLEFFLRKRKLI